MFFIFLNVLFWILVNPLNDLSHTPKAGKPERTQTIVINEDFNS